MKIYKDTSVTRRCLLNFKRTRRCLMMEKTSLREKEKWPALIPVSDLPQLRWNPRNSRRGRLFHWSDEFIHWQPGPRVSPLVSATSLAAYIGRPFGQLVGECASSTTWQFSWLVLPSFFVNGCRNSRRRSFLDCRSHTFLVEFNNRNEGR